MDTNEHELVAKDEVYQIVGAAMEVLNTLGHGLVEKPYERALIVELALRGVPYVTQPRFEVIYKGVKVGDYVPDIIVFDNIIVEIKCIDKITNVEMAQVINYLRITGFKVGIILNFKRPRLEWDRVVL